MVYAQNNTNRSSLSTIFVALLLVTILTTIQFGQLSRSVQAQTSSHTVQYGDTLAKIAQRYGVDLWALAETNNIVNANLIYIGQVLQIPSGDVVSTPQTPAEPQTNIVHVVQWGESLAGIAVQYGVNLWAIQQANNLSSINLIFAGQILIIPSGTISTPPQQAPTVVNRQVIVDISDQRTYLLENGVVLYNFLSSTGRPGNDTWTGSWTVRTKIPNAYASSWDLQMPFWLGFYTTGSLENGFHALPIMSDGSILWDGYLGTKVSYGCVILSYPNAEILYNFATVGTPVTVRQ